MNPANSDATSHHRPLVSVILAVRNEVTHIEKVLQSLLKQETEGFDLEILVIDGKSHDGTLEIVEQIRKQDARIRVLVNAKQRTPSAFNLGLRHSHGEFVCILGAHASYDGDYLATCLRELKAHNAVGCGGLVQTEPADSTFQARLVAWILAHPFASSARSFRTQKEGFVDGVNFPLFKKSAILEIGAYDERLHRNQDNDLNQRLRARGYKLFVTGKTRCLYFPKSSISSLYQYAFRTGCWNLLTTQKSKNIMGLRHFVPFLYVMTLIGALCLLVAGAFFGHPFRILFVLPTALIVGAHLAGGALSALQVVMRTRHLGALVLPFAILGFHVSYGLGTCWALVTRQTLPLLEEAPDSPQPGAASVEQASGAQLQLSTCDTE